MMNKKTADQLAIAKALEQAFEEANAVLTTKVGGKTSMLPDPQNLFEWDKKIKQDVIDIPTAMNHEQRLGRVKKLVGTAISALADIYRLEMYKSLGFMEKHEVGEEPVVASENNS